MLGLTILGTLHTAISLVAVIAGVVAFFRYKGISFRTGAGKVYVILTVVTCLTGFGIFQHGGFGIPHALGIVTLIVLAIAATAGAAWWFGRLSPYVETVSYSLTFYFHMIPGVTETSTRLPIGAPFFPGPEAPELRIILGALFAVYLIGATMQVLWLRSNNRRASPRDWPREKAWL